MAKKDVFEMKESPIVTATIQGGIYDPYRIVFDNDDIQVSKSDYNAYRIILKNTYTEAIDASEYFDELWSILKADAVCTFSVTTETLGSRNFIGAKVTIIAEQGNSGDNSYHCRGTLVYGNVNAAIEFHASTKEIVFLTGTLPE